MAGGMYTLDPQTGMPLIQTAGGGYMPVPLSEQELQANGLRLADVPKPDMGPDQRLAFNGGGATDLGNTPPDPSIFAAQDAADFRANFAPPQQRAPGANEHPTQPRQPGWMPSGEAQQAKRPPGVDPSTLARGGGTAPQQGQASGGDNGEAAIREQLMREALQGGGGGGPRRLGVTAETQKLKTKQFAMDPELKAQAEQVQSYSDKYNEQLATLLRDRHQQAYEAQQGEFAARAGQLAAAQDRFDRQQTMLADYAAKRDAAIEEARQMKAPQMEEYWGSRGTFANVMTGLSIALGGALQGLRGGQNPGLEMSNQSIERWLQAQREDYQRAAAHADRVDNQYGRLVQQFGSENLALEHMREQAWEVRDGMLRAYAEKIGTPDALENYNQAMLASEAEKAALRARASQGAEVEIEQKLSMQGGGGPGRKTFRQALAETAGGIKDYREIVGGGQANPNRAIDSGKTEALAAALETVGAADEITKHVTAMGYADDDADDPRSGAIDYIKNNVPGTQMRRTGQDLDLATFSLARGAQQFLGKSDNDAALAEKQASGLGGSGRQRVQAAQRLKQKAISKAKLELSAMTPDQRAAFLQALAPDQRQLVEGIYSSDSRGATSEQAVP